jgi:hypothetical protein
METETGQVELETVGSVWEVLAVIRAVEVIAGDGSYTRILR